MTVVVVVVTRRPGRPRGEHHRHYHPIAAAAYQHNAVVAPTDAAPSRVGCRIAIDRWSPGAPHLYSTWLG